MKHLADLKETGGGFSVSGEIGFDNVVALRKRGNGLIDQVSVRELTVDLSQIESSNSAGLSLFLRWLAYANQQEKKISFVNVPESLYKVAEVCGVAVFVKGE